MQGKILGRGARLLVATSVGVVLILSVGACSSTTKEVGVTAAAAADGAIPDSCYVHAPQVSDAGFSGAATPTRCAGDAECGAGARCDTALSPPTCIVLYCLPEAAPCAHAEECNQGMQCHKGTCNSCTQCGDLCEVDFATDSQHCGDCNQPVGANRVCENGHSVCATATPLACGSACVDPMTDPKNCGSCKNVVPANAECSNGKPTCNAGLASCGSSCVDLANDSSNCGSCAHACGGGLSCSERKCSGKVPSNGTTTCSAVCSAHGAQCTYGEAHYSGRTSSHSEGIGCASLPPASASWPDGTQGCYMGTCYPGHDSGDLTGIQCDCSS